MSFYNNVNYTNTNERLCPLCNTYGRWCTMNGTVDYTCPICNESDYNVDQYHQSGCCKIFHRSCITSSNNARKAQQQEMQRRQQQQQQQQQQHQQMLALQQQQVALQRQQMQEAARQKEAERVAKENERIKREKERDQILSLICISYMQLTEIQVPNINRLCLLLDAKYAEYIPHYNHFKAESDRLNDCHLDVIRDPNIHQLIMVGVTGHGKSTFGNRLSGIDVSRYGDTGPFGINHSTTDSVTDRIKKYTRHDKKISIIDTPGIFDSYGNDNFNLNKVIEYLRGTNGINAFIIVCRAGRLDSKYQELLSNLQSMLTSKFWSNVIFVVTWCQDQIADNWIDWKKK
eukprot:207706_1